MAKQNFKEDMRALKEELQKDIKGGKMARRYDKSDDEFDDEEETDEEEQDEAPAIEAKKTLKPLRNPIESNIDKPKEQVQVIEREVTLGLINEKLNYIISKIG